MKPLKPFAFFFRYLFLALGAFTFFAGIFVTLTVLSIGQTKTKNVLAEILDVSKPAIQNTKPSLPANQFDTTKTQELRKNLQTYKEDVHKSIQRFDYQIQNESPEAVVADIKETLKQWNPEIQSETCSSYSNTKRCNIEIRIKNEFYETLEQKIQEAYTPTIDTNIYKTAGDNPFQSTTEFENALEYRLSLLDLYHQEENRNQYAAILKDLTQNQLDLKRHIEMQDNIHQQTITTHIDFSISQ